MTRSWSYLETQKAENADNSANSVANQELLDANEVYTEISFKAIDSLKLMVNNDEENVLNLMSGDIISITTQHGFNIMSLKIVDSGKKYSYIAGKRIK